MTISSEIRRKLGLDVGTIFELKEVAGSIVMTPVPRLEAGKVIGEAKYRRIIYELDSIGENGVDLARESIGAVAGI